MPFAHPQQLRRFSATQPTRLMQPNRIENPGHSDLLQHAIPPAETGQIVCYKTRTYRVSPTADTPSHCGPLCRGLNITPQSNHASWRRGSDRLSRQVESRGEHSLESGTVRVRWISQRRRPCGKYNLV